MLLIQSGSIRLFGVELIGVNAITGRKVLISLGCIIAGLVLGRVLRAIARALLKGRKDVRARFWSEQAIHIVLTIVLLLFLVSLWFDDPSRLATPAGLMTAGLAVALQRVITAVAGYFVILSGRVFSVGDRIVLGGVRGDVIALGYTRTKIMEMGEPPSMQDADPTVWVEARQYTGRIVTVTNDKVFDEAVFNYTREFPYIWEELRLPVRFQDDWARAEAILLETARKHTVDLAEIGRPALEDLKRTYVVNESELHPRVYWRITDNWLEMTVRFIARDRGVRDLKDAMSRDILKALKEAGIEVASATYDIVGMPPLEIRRVPASEAKQGGGDRPGLA